MPIPIPDLVVDEKGISCTLSFNRAPFWCRVPWSAIYALVGEDSQGMVWPSDVPSEVATQLQPAPREAPLAEVHAVDEAASKPKKKGKLKEVSASPDAAETQVESPKPKPKRKGSKASQGEESSSSRLEATEVPPKKASRSKRSGTKDEGAAAAPLPRPRLVPAPLAEEAPLASPAPPPAAPKALPRFGAATKKPKRPLPDYLRVVK
jgi:hypothetical protein